MLFLKGEKSVSKKEENKSVFFAHALITSVAAVGLMAAMDTRSGGRGRGSACGSGAG